MEVRGVRAPWELELDSCELPDVNPSPLSAAGMTSQALSPLCSPGTLLSGEPRGALMVAGRGAHVGVIALVMTATEKAAGEPDLF